MMFLTLANQITLVRILAVPVFVALLLNYSVAKDYLRIAALGVFVFSVVTDLLDGYIARKHNQRTPLGAILDPLADKILLVSAFVFCFVKAAEFPALNFPAWLVVTVISRDAILVTGAVIAFMLQDKLVVDVSAWGKATTFFQVACVIGFLMQWPASQVLWAPTFALTVLSGMDYLIRGSSRVSAQPGREKS